MADDAGNATFDDSASDEGSPLDSALNRRTLLRGVGAGAVLLGGGSVLDACSSSLKGNSASSSNSPAPTGSSGGSATGKTITIGFVTPLTGPLAGFATSDQYVVDTIKKTTQYSNGIKIGGTTYPVNIVVADSQSDPNRASQVTKQLITHNHADMVLVTSTPEVTNPVASVCEAQGVPCVATVVPWESWYFGRGAKPGTTFTYTTMFFFGIPEFGKCFIPMWNKIPNDKTVALMYPSDADGTAFRQGFPPLMHKAHYKTVDGGAYTDGQTDYTSMIAKFKSDGGDIYSNAPLPPDFNVFWKQAAQQGYKPKLATVAKVLLFPADCTALGDLVINVATDAWWTPSHPYKSSLDGMTSKELGDGFTAANNKQWVQALGSTYSLFEVAYNAFLAAADPHNAKQVAAKLRTMSYSGMVGPLDFAKGPVPGVAIIEPVGVQWKKGTGKFPYEMQIVDNSANKDIPLTGNLEPTNA
jgi:branched-chain amino acid transport system substrate-binding protein